MALSPGPVLLVADLMTAPVVAIEADATLREAHDLLHREGIHHLVVTSGGRFVGVLSDRDVLRNLSPFLGTLAEQPRDLTTLMRRVFNVASYQPVLIAEAADVHEAAATLLEHGISSLLVTDSSGAISGIVTMRDLLRALLTCSLADTRASDQAVEPSPASPSSPVGVFPHRGQGTGGLPRGASPTR